jgi:hypothetical protein
MGYSIDYKKLYEQIETVNDWLDLLKNPNFNWTECMLSLSNYKPGDYSFEKIGTINGTWNFQSDNLKLKASESLDNNEYADKSEIDFKKQYNFHHGYKEYESNELANSIAKALGFTDYKAAINIQEPGSIKNLHADSLNGWFKDVEKYQHVALDKNLKQPKGTQNLHRVFVALTDWEPGWMWQFGVDHWTNWKKGDVVNFDWRNVPHCTANAGYSPRPILKITGVSEFIDKNKHFNIVI